jgi:flagellar FliJ protein
MAGKKFRFPLAKVLRLRHHETDEARLNLARTLRTRQAQEARVSDARDRLDMLSRQDLPSGTFTPAVLRRQDGFRLDAQEALDRELATLARFRQEEDQARAQLLERQRAEESLKTLQAEARERHKRAQQEAETSFLDEQALIGYSRKQQPTNK